MSSSPSSNNASPCVVYQANTAGLFKDNKAALKTTAELTIVTIGTVLQHTNTPIGVSVGTSLQATAKPLADSSVESSIIIFNRTQTSN